MTFYSDHNDPFKYPEGFPVVFQFSGGRTSAYMLKCAIERNGRPPDYTLFQNTGREMPETLDFVNDAEKKFKCKIIWLEYRDKKPFYEVVGHNSASRNGEPFESIINKKQYLPNVVTRYCSDVLKYRTAKRYLVNIGEKKWYSAIGFRYDEAVRVLKIRARKHSREIIWTPLYDAKLDKNHVKNFWDKSEFDLNLKNIKGKTPLGNCDGCFLKSESNLANLQKHYPEKALWWEMQEERINRTFNKDWSRAELRKFVESQADMFEKLEEEGVFCDSSHGSCETY